MTTAPQTPEQDVLAACQRWRADAEPMGLGALFTRAARLLKDNLRLFVTLAAPLVALELFTREGASTLFSRARAALGLSIFDAGQSEIEFTQPVIMWLAAASLLFLASILVNQWLGVLATRVTCHIMAGDEARAGTAWAGTLRLAMRTVIALTAMYSLILLAASAPTLLTIGAVFVFAADVPNAVWVGLFVLDVIAFMIIVVTLGLRWALVATVLALEECGVRESFARSASLLGPDGVRLLRGPKLSLSVLLLLVWAVASSVQSTFLIPMIVFAISQGIPPDQWPPPLVDMPLYLSGPVFFLQIGIHAVIMPIAGIVAAFFYVDTDARYGPEDAA